MKKAQALANAVGGNMKGSITARTRVDTPHAAEAADPKYIGIKKSKNAVEIEVDRIIRDEDQPRQKFDEDKIRALADSLQAKGQLQPIRVRWDDAWAAYKLIAGERRWRAAKLAGLPTITAVIHESELSESEAKSLQLIENLIREDLQPMEQAHAFRDLMESEGWSIGRLAKELSISQPTVTRSLALLDMPKTIQKEVEQGNLTPAAAYEVRQIPDPAQQVAVAREVVTRKLTRDQTRSLVRARKSGATERHARETAEFEMDGFHFTVQGPVNDTDALWAAWRKVLETHAA